MPDFDYEHKGKVLDLTTEIESLFDLSIQDEFNLNILPKSYDENACTIHVQKIQVFIDEPLKFLTTISAESQYNFGKLDIFSSFTSHPIDFDQEMSNIINNKSKGNNKQRDTKGKKKKGLSQINLNQT